MTTGHLSFVKLPIAFPEPEIASWCEKWKVAELAVFGSVLRVDFRADSDVNVLISFEPGATFGLFDVAQMEAELEKLLGRDVMILPRRGVELSSNRLRRQKILESAEVVYARRSRAKLPHAKRP